MPRKLDLVILTETLRNSCLDTIDSISTETDQSVSRQDTSDCKHPTFGIGSKA